MNSLDKAIRNKINKSGGIWRKHMKTEHTTTVFGAFRTMEKQRRGRG